MLKHIQTSRPPPERERPDEHPRYQNMPRRHLPLNVSTLDSSKHSVGGTSASVSPGTAQPAPPPQPPKLPNGVAVVASPPPRLAPRRPQGRGSRAATEEALTSLALLCLVSLLLALLSLLFLLKISPGAAPPAAPPAPAAPAAPEEFAVVYEVTLALCALTLSLNLCCLLVCAIQFLFAVKLVHSPTTPSGRSNKYLQKAALTRVCAVGGFFISIPVFLTGIILYTFIQFQSTPAIVSSVLVGLGIVFCGCAMVHNVFVWQREKTSVVKALRSQELLNVTGNTLNMSNGGLLANGHASGANTTLGNLSFHSVAAAAPAHVHYPHPVALLQHGPYVIRPPTSTPPGEGVPIATLDLSHEAHELSTLV